MLVSEDVANQTSEQFFFREVDVVAPAGTSKPTKILELLGSADEHGAFPVSPQKRSDVADWTTCYALYRERSWRAALDALTKYRETKYNKVLADTYISRCQSCIYTPPPTTWDGDYAFRVK